MISFKNKKILVTGATGGIGREIVKKFNPGLVFSEMIASRALIEKNLKTLKMIKKASNEYYAIQLAGCDPIVMGEAAKICEDAGADLVQIYTGFIYKGPSLVKKINTELILH